MHFERNRTTMTAAAGVSARPLLIPASPHVVPTYAPPSHKAHHKLPANHPGSCGGERDRGLLTRSSFPREMRNRDFAAGGRRASHSSQRLRRTRPRAPVAARKRQPLELTVRQRRRGQRRPKWPSQIFWGVATAPDGLRLPPGTPGSWKWPKNKNTTINQ